MAELNDNDKALVMQSCEMQVKTLISDHPEIKSVPAKYILLIFRAGMIAATNAFSALTTRE